MAKVMLTIRGRSIYRNACVSMGHKSSFEEDTSMGNIEPSNRNGRQK